jgi:hypothetical protein
MADSDYDRRDYRPRRRRRDDDPPWKNGSFLLIILALVGGDADHHAYYQHHPADAAVKFIDDDKIDNARQTASNITDAAEEYEDKVGEVDFTRDGLGMLTPYLDKGEAGLYDPWGKMYQVRYVQKPSKSTSSARRHLYVFTHHPNTGREIGWPREFEPAAR